jgi:hypothetical protein
VVTSHREGHYSWAFPMLYILLGKVPHICGRVSVRRWLRLRSSFTSASAVSSRSFSWDGYEAELSRYIHLSCLFMAFACTKTCDSPPRLPPPYPNVLPGAARITYITTSFVSH